MQNVSIGPNQLTGRIPFDKRPGTSAAGPAYEIHLLMLFLLRGLNEAETFYLGSNIKDALAFDDIVFQFNTKNKNGNLKSKIVFMQAKHKQNIQNHIINEKTLLSDKTDFGLNKYFSSYLEIKKLFSQPNNSKFATFVKHFLKVKDKEFIIYTNANAELGFDKSKKSLVKGEDKMLSSKNGCDKVLQLNMTNNGPLVKKFTNEFEYLGCNRNMLSPNANEIEEFFAEFKLFVGQSDEKQLEKIIKQEISCYYDVTEENSNYIFLQIKSKVQSWWKTGDYFLTEMDNFFEMERQTIFKSQIENLCSISMQKQKLEELGVKYKKEGFKNIRKKLKANRIINIIAKKGLIVLSSIKILQLVNGIPEYQLGNSRFIFVKLKDLIHLPSQMLQALKFSGSYDLLTVESKTNAKNLQDTQEVYSKLSDIIINSNDKKMILITEDDDQCVEVFQKDTRLSDKYHKITDTTSFVNLTEETQTKLISKQVIFQGVKISLSEILSLNHEISNDAIDLDILLKLIQNEDNISIGTQPLKMSELETAYARLYEDISFNNLLGYILNNRDKSVIFLISGTENSIIGKVENEINRILREHQSNVGNICLVSANPSNLYQNDLSEINKFVVVIQKQNDNESQSNTFKHICRNNSNKLIYWFEIASKQICLQQIYDPNFYLPRRFKYNKIKWVDANKIYQQLTVINSPFTFVFSGVGNQHYFPRLFALDENQQNLLKNIKKRTIRLFSTETEAQAYFDFLCNEGKFVHWFKVQEFSHNIMWCRSNCSLDNIRNCVNQTQIFTPCEETEFIKHVKENVVIIADEPGMGKSTTLTSLSNKMLDTHWVIRIDFKDCADAISALSLDSDIKNISVENIVNFLSNATGAGLNSNLTKICLLHSLQQKVTLQNRPLLFLFDGFDEIDTNLQVNIIPLLQFIKYKTVAKLWVTTRIHKMQYLENSLGTFATKFEEVQPDKQVSFLANFWRVRLKLFITNQENRDTQSLKLQVCSNTLLHKTKSILGDTMSKMMGVPLQLRLLGEGFISDVAEFLKTKHNENYMPNFEHLNVLTMYQRFIDGKYDIYFKEKIKFLIQSTNIRSRLIQSFENDHQLLSVKSLFASETDDDVQSFIAKFISIDCNKIQDLVQLGIIGSIDTNGNVHFIHKTFAEYFCAGLLVRFLKNRERNPLKCESTLLFLKSLFQSSNDSNEVVHNFANLMLAKNSLLSTAVLNQNAPEVATLLKNATNFQTTDSLGRTLLHIAALKGNFDIFKKFLETGYESVDQDIFGKSPLHYAVQYRNKDAVKYLLNYKADIDISNHIICKPLLLYTEVNDTVFNKAGNEKSILFQFVNKQDAYCKTALQYAVEHKNWDIASMLLLNGASTDKLHGENKAQLLTYVLNETTSRYSEYHELSPVLALLLLRTNSERFGKRGDEYQYPMLLSYFYEYGHVKVISAVLNTIHNSIRRFKVLNNPVNLLKPLQKVLSSDLLSEIHSFEVIQYLLSNGAHTNEFGTRKTINDILISAAEKGHLQTFKFFINRGEMKNYYSYLYAAACKNHLNIVKYMWQNYGQGIIDVFGSTALHAAADSGTFRCVKYLVEYGADVNAVDNVGRNPAHFAAVKARLYVLKYLVDNGANADAVDRLGTTAFENVILDYFTTVMCRSQHFKNGDDLDILKYLSFKCGGKSAIHTINCVTRFFKNQHMFNLNYVNEQEIPRLHWAIILNEVEWANFLIRQGADVNQHDGTYKSRTPLHWLSDPAVERGYPEMVELLLQCGAIYDAHDVFHKTPCEYSRASSDSKYQRITSLFEILKQLFNSKSLMQDLNEQVLQNGCSPYDELELNPMVFILNARNNAGKMLLHVAAENNDLLAANCLLSYDKLYLDLKIESAYPQNQHFRDYLAININTKDVHGNTPLYLAARNGHYEMLNLLIQNGAIFSYINMQGFTPHKIAQINNFSNIAQFLRTAEILFDAVDIGLKLKSESVNMSDYVKNILVYAKYKYGRTFLHLAVSKDQVQNVIFLIKHGSDINAADLNGFTPLHFAAQNNNADIILLLLRNGCIFNVKNNEGKTPMDILKCSDSSKSHLLKTINHIYCDILNDNSSTALRCLNAMEMYDCENINVVINCRDFQGNTLLHVAAREGYFDIVQLILRHGAIYNCVNKKYQTPQLLTTDSKIKKLLICIEELFEWKSNLTYTIDEIERNGLKTLIQNVRDNEGKTILHNAVENNYYRVKYIVSSNNNLTTKDNSGKTIIQSAKERGQLGVIKFLHCL